MSENVVSVRLEIRNEKTRKDLEEVLASIQEFHLQASNDPKPCDLLILETEKDISKDFELIQTLQVSGMVKEVFLTSPHVEPDLLPWALRAGVKEFFSQPIKREEVRNGLLKFRERRGDLKQDVLEKKRGKIIDIVGSKGGVGTTTIAVNVATSLSESNGASSVALIDMNLLFGQIPIFFNIESSLNLGEVARNISRVDATYLMSTLSKHRSGVYILPSPMRLDDVDVVTPEILEVLLGLMQNVFDFIVIDGGQRLDNVSFKILGIADIVFLITGLDLPCLANAKRLLRTFQKLRFPSKEAIQTIVNCYQKKSPFSLKDAEQAVSAKIHWVLPNDHSATTAAINQGKPLSEVAPGSELNKSLRELADSFLSKNPKRRNGFWKREESD